MILISLNTSITSPKVRQNPKIANKNYFPGVAYYFDNNPIIS